VGFHQFLQTYDQSEARIEPIERLSREKGGMENLAGCSKRPSSKAAASEDARRTLRYVELLSEVRTPLADFFSSLPLLDACPAL
jgi:hypothetical protein